jgi:hypothetical protein
MDENFGEHFYQSRRFYLRIFLLRNAPRPDVMILKIFSPKYFAKNWLFLLKTKLNFEKVDHNIGI